MKESVEVKFWFFEPYYEANVVIFPYLFGDSLEVSMANIDMIGFGVEVMFNES